MFCAISGISPEEPVVSKKSGHVFERRLISKALAASGGKCPVTGEDLSEDDLLPVQLSGDATRPIPASAATLPGLLTHMQSEWDAIALETFSLKKALSAAHQELATSLYKYDAATRVIARLVKERDEARAALADRKTALASGVADDAQAVATKGAPYATSSVANDTDGATGGGDAMEDVSNDASEAAKGGVDVVLNEQVLAKVKSKHQEMTAGRLKRKKSSTLASAKLVREYVETHNVDVTSEDDIFIRSLQPVRNKDSSEGEVVSAGCSDGAIRMYSSEDLSSSGVGAAKAHSGAVTHLAYNAVAHSSLLFSGGEDGFVRGWDTPALQALPLSANGSPTSSEKNRGNGRSTRPRKSSDVTALPDPVVPAVEFAPEEGSSPSTVVGVSAHPCSDLVFSALESGRWRVHSTETGKLIGSGSSNYEEDKQGADSCAVHPDGAIFAVGLKNGAVDMWDLKEMSKRGKKPVAELGKAGCAAGSAACIRMSENGYYMIVSGGGFVRVWDLRELKMVREAKIAECESTSPGLGVALDWSGSFCAATNGGGVVRLFETRKLKRIADVSCGSQGDPLVGGSVGIAWGTDAKCIFASSVVGRGRLARFGLDLAPAPGKASGE